MANKTRSNSAKGKNKLKQDFLLDKYIIDHQDFIVGEDINGNPVDYLPFLSIVQNFDLLHENGGQKDCTIVTQDIEAHKFYFYFLQAFYYYAFCTVYFSIFHCETDDPDAEGTERDDVKLEQKSQIIKDCEVLKPCFEFLEPLAKTEPDYREIAYSLGFLFFSYVTKEMHNITTPPINAKRNITKDAQTIDEFKRIIDIKTSIPFYLEAGKSGENMHEFKQEIEEYQIFNKILNQIEADIKGLSKQETPKILSTYAYYKIPNDRGKLEKALYSINSYYGLNATDEIKFLLSEITKLKDKITAFTHEAFNKEIAELLSKE
ncbi:MULTISPECIES: hypothetical protein [Campylobacter]|uniref:hypothetical protein n=1 Tax=Campylobacter TaxID=194 RepID=UPI00027A38F7|nr:MULTISPECIES: hypothetical protein [Campylobacter]EJP75136.1 hypothetical protein HMPREF1139_1335 [Campylobacter sp. FOBRC14]